MEEQSEIFGEVMERLEKTGIPYMITGGFAVSFWGKLRSTFDLDLVIEVTPNDIPKLIAVFSPDFYIDADMIREAISGSKFFNIIHQKTQIKADFHLRKDDPYSRLRFERRKRITLLGHTTSIITAEDLILIKLLWYKDTQSTKHLEDAQSIMAIQGDALNTNYLKQWAQQQGTAELLQQLLE